MFGKKTYETEPYIPANSDTDPMPNSPKAVREEAVTAARERLDQEKYPIELKAKLPIHSELPTNVSEALIAKFQAKSVHEYYYARGAMNRIYLVFRENQPPLTVKVERISKSTDPNNTELYDPWVNFGLNNLSEDEATNPEKRNPLTDVASAAQRREVHLRVAHRLESVGIHTAEYIGSMLLDGYDPDGKPSPMYAEIWEFVGENSLGSNEAQLAQLYGTPEGRAKLTQLAQGLIQLGEQGFCFDVSGQNSLDENESSPDEGAAEGLLFDYTKKTPHYELPYPKNFIQNPSGDLIAIDFNVGFDLVGIGVWPDSLKGRPLVITGSDQRLYYNNELETEVSTQVRERIAEESRANHRYLMQLKEADPEFQTKLEAEKVRMTKREMFWIRVDREVSRLFEQVAVACQMLNKIKECETDPALVAKLLTLKEPAAPVVDPDDTEPYRPNSESLDPNDTEAFHPLSAQLQPNNPQFQPSPKELDDLTKRLAETPGDPDVTELYRETKPTETQTGDDTELYRE